MENMIDIKHKKCINFECEKLPSYNYEGEIKAIYCLEHKKELMVNVKDKKCQHIGCKTHTAFNFQGENIPLYCSIHKEEIEKQIERIKNEENNELLEIIKLYYTEYN